MLEDASIKLSTVATSLKTVSARAILPATIDGETDARVLAEMRRKIPDLARALEDTSTPTMRSWPGHRRSPDRRRTRPASAAARRAFLAQGPSELDPHSAPPVSRTTGASPDRRLAGVPMRNPEPIWRQGGPHPRPDCMSVAAATVTSMPFREKHLAVPGPVTAAGRVVKRYHVTADPEPIPGAIEAAALAMLPDLLPEPDADTVPTGFLVLHRGGDGAVYLNTYSWVWGNVLSAVHAAAAQPALDCPDDDPTHFMVLRRPWIGCVWELPPLEHERSAFVRHVLCPEKPDVESYLADSMAPGLIGL
jgi:hypothetical protein